VLGPKAKAYVELAKPRVLLGVVALFTASALASTSLEGGRLSLAQLMAATAAAAGLVAGANVLNNLFDRDLDALMYRTRRRPLPSRRVGESEALALGASLTSTSLVALAFIAPSTLWIAALALTSYLVAYTAWLKRRSWLAVASATPAVASPVLAGWLIGAGRLTTTALLYAGIAALWGLMHFWALATVFREDYRRASVPTLPSRLGPRASAWVMAALAIAIALLALRAASMRHLSPAGLASTLGLNAILVALALKLVQRPLAGRRAWRLYKFSSPYVVLLLLSATLPCFA